MGPSPWKNGTDDVELLAEVPSAWSKAVSINPSSTIFIPVSPKCKALRSPCNAVYIQNHPGLLLSSLQHFMTAISDSTAIILGTHLQHVFPKNPTWFSGEEKKSLYSFNQFTYLNYYKSKTTCHEIVMETNTTSGKHTTPSVQHALIWKQLTSTRGQHAVS